MLPNRFLDIAAGAALRVFGGDAVAAAEFLAGPNGRGDPADRKRKADDEQDAPEDLDEFKAFLTERFQRRQESQLPAFEDDPVDELIKKRALQRWKIQKDSDFSLEQAEAAIVILHRYQRDFGELTGVAARQELLENFRASRWEANFTRFVEFLIKQKAAQPSSVESQDDDPIQNDPARVVEYAKRKAMDGMFQWRHRAIKEDLDMDFRVIAAIGVVFGLEGFDQDLKAKLTEHRNDAIKYLSGNQPPAQKRARQDAPQSATVVDDDVDDVPILDSPALPIRDPAKIDVPDSDVLALVVNMLGSRFDYPKYLNVTKEEVRNASADGYPRGAESKLPEANALINELAYLSLKAADANKSPRFQNYSLEDQTGIHEALHGTRWFRAARERVFNEVASGEDEFGDAFNVSPEESLEATGLVSPVKRSQSKSKWSLPQSPLGLTDSDEDDGSSSDESREIKGQQTPPSTDSSVDLEAIEWEIDNKKIRTTAPSPPARQTPVRPLAMKNPSANEEVEMVDAPSDNVRKGDLFGENDQEEQGDATGEVPAAKDAFDTSIDKKFYLPYALMLKREDSSKNRTISQPAHEQLKAVVKVLGDKPNTLPPNHDTFNSKWKKEDLSGVPKLPDARDMRAVFSRLRPGGDYSEEIARAVAEMIRVDKRLAVYRQIVEVAGDAQGSAPNFDNYTGSLDPIARGIVEAYGDRHPDTLKDEFTAVRRALKEIRAANAPKVKGARTGGRNTGASKPREPAKPADETGGKEVINMSVTATALRYLKLLGYSSVPRTGRTNFALADVAGLTNEKIGKILGITKGALKGKRDQASKQTPADWKKMQLPSVAERVRVFNQYLYPEIGKKRGAFFRFAIWKAIQNANINDAADVFERATGKKPADDELNLSDPEIGDVKFSKNGNLAVAFAANIVDAVLDEMEQAPTANLPSTIDLSAALVLSRGNEALAARLLARLG